jgi:hypothetical protein
MPERRLQVHKIDNIGYGWFVSEFLTITCPHCGEDFEIPFDPGEGGSGFIIDCEVCCRPMTVTVRLRAGEVNSVEVQAA